MNPTNRRFLIFLCLVGEFAFAWTQGIFPINRGHEELTRLAIIQSGVKFISVPKENEVANDSEHPVILGNFAMDFPRGKGGGMELFMKRQKKRLREACDKVVPADTPTDAIKKMVDLLSIVFINADFPALLQSKLGPAKPNWQEAPRLQPLHFLRTPGTTAKTSCEIAREQIRFLWGKQPMAAELGKKDPIEAANQEYANELYQFYLGGILHIIQDSYSAAHTVRGGADKSRLDDLCVFKPAQPVPGVCLHADIDERDSIWEKPLTKPLPLGTDTYALLNEEAKAAVKASAAFLNAASEVRDGALRLKHQCDADIRAFPISDIEKLDEFVKLSEARIKKFMADVKTLAEKKVDTLTFLNCPGN